MADSPFLKPLAGWRSIIPRAGETLADLALRELGDATLWTLIAWVNGLRAPYIVQSPDAVVDGTVMFGTPLRVPAGAPEPASGQADLYYTDIQLTAGRLSVTPDGDLQLVSGVANLAQGLRHRLMVDRQELVFHPTYGAYISQLLGQGLTPADLKLCEFYARSSLLEDERVRSVASIVATATLDSITLVAKVIAVSGVTVDLQITI